LEELKNSYAADEILGAPRIGSGLKSDVSHRVASYLSAEQLSQLSETRVFSIRGYDGVQRTLVQTLGESNGEKGVFEYIIEPNGSISHQRFIEEIGISGKPNMSIEKWPQ